MWDNERLHAEEDLPLYVAWRRRQESAKDDDRAPPPSSSPSVEPKEVLVMADNQDPEYKALMQQVIAGVQHNDLLQVRWDNSLRLSQPFDRIKDETIYDSVFFPAAHQEPPGLPRGEGCDENE